MVIVPVGERMAEIGRLMAPLGERVAGFLPDHTAQELQTVAGFLERLLDAVAATRVQLQADADS